MPRFLSRSRNAGKKLPKPLRKELETALEKQAAVYSLETIEAFAAGFRLGMRLSVEVFHETGLTK